MNALLASIFSPLKESVASRNGQALDRLEAIATPTKKRARAPRKSVSFDMTPKKQVKHTPPRSAQATLAHERLSSPRKRRAAATVEILEDSKDVTEPRKSSTRKRRAVHAPPPPPPPADHTDTAAEEEQDTDKPTPKDDEAREFAFKKFVGHRWDDDDAMQIHVEWEGGGRTWEPEAALHGDAPDALLGYWRAQPGGRPDNPRQPGLYEIHAIRKHSRDRKRLFVEWVGYGPGERTWEPRGVVEDAAPGMVTEYWDSLPRPKRRRTAR